MDTIGVTGMVDAVAAISLPGEQTQVWDIPENADPNDVARFERAFTGQGNDILPAEGETLVEPKGMGNTVLQNIMSIDNRYQTLFVDEMDKIFETNSIIGDNLIQSNKDSTSPFDLDPRVLLKHVRETHALSIRMHALSMQLNLSASTVTTVSGGLNKMLRSGGG